MTGRRGALRVTLAAMCVAALALAGVLLTRDEGAAKGWSFPERAPVAGAGVARLDVDRDGGMIAAWAQERRGRWSLQVAERAPGGEWQAAETIVSDKLWTIRPESVQLNDAGDAVVVFTYYARSRALALASVRPRGRDWEAPQGLMPVRYGIAGAELALDDSGAVTTGFGDFFGGVGVNVTARPAGGPWRDPVRLAAAQSVNRLGLSAGAGRVALTADTGTLGSPGKPGRIRAVVFTGPAGGRLSAVANLPADARRMSGVVAALGADGRLSLVWRDAGAGRSRGRLLAARQDPAGGWTSPVVLDEGRLEIEGPSIEVAGDRLVVAWARWERVWREVSVQSAILDGSGQLVARPQVDRFPVADIRGPNPGRTLTGPPPAQVLTASGDGQVSVLWSRTEEGREPTVFTRPLYSSDLSGDAWSRPQRLPGGDSASLVVAFERSEHGLVAAWAGALDDGRVAGLEVATRDG